MRCTGLAGQVLSKVMSASPTPDDLTHLLQLASESPEYRDQFLRALLTSTVFFLATSKALPDTKFTAQGHSFTIKDEHTQFDFVELRGRNGPAIPFWTSLDELENDLHRMKMGQQPYVALPGLPFFEAASGRRVVLNPGTFGREFSPEQVGGLLNRARAESAAAREAEAAARAEVERSAAQQPEPVAFMAPEPIEELAPADDAEPQMGDSFEDEFQQFLRQQEEELPVPPPDAEPEFDIVATEANVDLEVDNAEQLLNNMFMNVPFVIEMLTPLLYGRSDEAWELLERLKAEGRTDGLIRALSLLLFTLVDRIGREGEGGPMAVLQDGAAYWSEWSQWAEEQPDLLEVDVATLRSMSEQLCGCGHPAHRHGRYSWALRDVGIQTDSPCDARLCICEGFFVDES